MLPASARPRGDTGAHTPERKDSRRALPDRARFRPRRSSRLSPTPVLNESDRLRLSRAMRSEEPRLNSSHVETSYAVFCLKKKKELEERLDALGGCAAVVDAQP